MTYSYKWMLPGLITPMQKIKWPVEIGEWTKKESPVLCKSGWHGVEEKDVLNHLPTTIGAELWWVEVKGEGVTGRDKFCAEQMRLVSLVGTTTEENLRLFACDCAEDVQPEDADPRSLDAIAVARRYAVGEATREELYAAEAAAWNAAEDAAWNAARNAAWNATRNAAWNAARAAAWNATRAAARAKYSNWLVVRLESGF